MPPNVSAHPADATLAAFGLGKTNDATTDLVSRHLHVCPDCRQRVASLSADSSVGKLRDTGVASTPGPDATDAGSAADRPLLRVGAEPTELSALSGQYEVKKELGRGGMGVVYLARNTLMRRDEVLKVVSAELLARPGAVERFQREISSAARLNHPNIVAAYSAHRPDGGLVFAMEYVPGVDLSELVKAAGPLPVSRACLYAAQAAAGLQHAHAKGMVHRDIKPSNLILSRADKKAVVKVLDFGLAKVTAADVGDPGLTRQGQMLGTPAYIAPEQAKDAASADIRADIYSLGCTLYYLLAGRPPFDGPPMTVIIAHQLQQPTPLPELRPEVSAEVWAVVQKMMAKNPADRYATPGEVAKALLPLAKMSAGKASEGSVILEPSKPEAVWAEPVYDAAVSTVQLRPGQKPPSQRLPLALVGGVLLAVGLAAAYLGGAFKVKTPNGVIVVENVPADAVVEVDGQTVKLTRNGQEIRVEGVAGGTHKLKVTAGGVEILSDDVAVKLGNDPVRVRVEPEKVAALRPEPPATPRPVPPATPDPLPVGSVWIGTRTYTKGGYSPSTVSYELHVTRRDGDKFSGHMFDNGTGRNESKIEGTLAGGKLSWTEKAAHAPDFLYTATGTLDGTTIRATERRDWKGQWNGEAYVVVKLAEAGRAFRKGELPEPAPPAAGFTRLLGPDVPWAGDSLLLRKGALNGPGNPLSVVADSEVGVAQGKAGPPDRVHLATPRADYRTVTARVTVPRVDQSRQFLVLRGGGSAESFTGYLVSFGQVNDANTGWATHPGYVFRYDKTKLGEKANVRAYTADAGKEPPFDPNRPYDIEATVTEDHVRVTVNGVQLCDDRDQAPLPPGHAGLLAFRAAGFTVNRFDLKEFPAPPAGLQDTVKPSPSAGSAYRVDGTWAVQGGVLRCTSDWGKVLVGDANWTDYDVTAEGRKVRGPDGFGVIVRAPGRLTPSAVFIAGGRGGTQNSVGLIGDRLLVADAATKADRFVADRWYTLTVRVRGKQVRCEVNGIQQFAVSLPNMPAAGSVGLHTWQNVCEFRTLRVTDPAGKVLWDGVPAVPAK